MTRIQHVQLLQVSKTLREAIQHILADVETLKIG